MALFSHYADGISALSITPQSVEYCASLLAMAEWVEYDDRTRLGAVRWEAGDRQLRVLSTFVEADWVNRLNLQKKNRGDGGEIESLWYPRHSSEVRGDAEVEFNLNHRIMLGFLS